MNLCCCSVSSLMKPLLRTLSYFRPDAGRIWVVLALLLASVGLNVLKPWPLALLVDNVLGKKPYPAWAPEIVKNWNALTQITAIALALLVISLVQAVCSAFQTYISRPNDVCAHRHPLTFLFIATKRGQVEIVVCAD